MVFYQKLSLANSLKNNFVDRRHHLYRLISKKKYKLLKNSLNAQKYSTVSLGGKKSVEDNAKYSSSCGKSLNLIQIPE